MKNWAKRSIRWSLPVLVIAALIFGYAYFIEPRQLIVNEQEIRIDGWEPAFDGLKIAAISDIHAGSNAVDQAMLRRIVETVNAQNADLVVLLGDHVSNELGRRGIKMPVSEIADGLVGMRATHGVFAVLGNQDGWYSDSEVAEGLREAGITVLENEIVNIERNGRRIRLLGLKDHLQLNSWYTFDQMVRKTVLDHGGSGQFIVLEHSPDILHVLNYHRSLGDDLKLMLAGHTHGGQIRLPLIGPPFVPSSFGRKYAGGHINEEGRDMFVTTGIGTSFLPLRFLVPPEIAVLTIRRK